MSIATGILQFKQDIDDVYKAGKLDPIASSESLNGNVSDVVISVNDVLPIEHGVSVKLGSKNLIDGSTILDGCEISGNTLISNPDWYVVSVDVLPNTQYTVSGFSSLTRVEEDINGIKTRANDRLDVFITLPTTVKVYFNSPKTVYGNNQLELGSTATPYTPYITDFSGVEVSRYGKNLFDVPSMVTFKGVLDYKNASFLKAGVTYVFYYDAATFDTESEGIVVNVYDGGAVFLKPQQAWRVTPKIDNPRMIVYSNGFDWNQSQGTTATITNFRICIADANYLEYEPYIEPTVYTANADGTVDGIISISPNMTLFSNNNAVSINAKYYKDPDIVMSNLQQAIALSGGE